MKRMGQGDGYAMAALLVAMSIAAILMTVALPVWKQATRRELEEELVFRGLQYTRAIRLFSQKYANAGPPNIDVLVEQRFLRKKYKDPITNDDFRPLLAGQSVPGSGTPSTGTSSRGGGSQAQRGGSQPSSSLTSIGAGASAPSGVGGIGSAGPAGRGGAPGTQGGPGGFGPGGGVIGVASKSKAESIRLYNGRNHYDEWAFIFTPQVQAPGAGAGGVGVPGQRGGRQGQQPENPFGSGIGGQRGRGGPNQGPGRGGQQPPPGRGTMPQSPFGPAQPILPPGRGRGL